MSKQSNKKSLASISAPSESDQPYHTHGTISADPATQNSQEPSNSSALLEAVDKLKFFLATAPGSFDPSPAPTHDSTVLEDRCFNRFPLPTGEQISCILWNGLYHITGTDIVRALNFRFLAFGRPVKNVKKFEEGIFSDLRNLKAGSDATLEEPKSDFLELLFKHNCIRTQKKQKVFYWFSVPHDRLFLDALDRDLKREKLGLDTTTQAVAEPALSFAYNPSKSLYEQFAKATSDTPSSNDSGQPTQAVGISATAVSGSASTATKRPRPLDTRPSAVSDSLLGAFSLFEGSPTYKQRRKTSGITNRKPTSALSRIARAPSQCSRSSNDAQHRQPSYSQSPVPEPSPHFGTSLPTSLPRHLYISSPASAPSAYYIQPQNSTGHLASAISRSPVLPTESFATMTSHLSTSFHDDISPDHPSPFIPTQLGLHQTAIPASSYLQSSRVQSETSLAGDPDHHAPRISSMAYSGAPPSSNRSRFWTEPPCENEGWSPYNNSYGRGQAVGLDSDPAQVWIEHGRRHQSEAPNIMNASTGFGMSWPAGADPYAGEDELSFGSAFSTVAALAETPLVPDVSTLPSEGAMMMNPSADYHADQSYPSAPPREQPEPLE